MNGNSSLPPPVAAASASASPSPTANTAATTTPVFNRPNSLDLSTSRDSSSRKKATAVFRSSAETSLTTSTSTTSGHHAHKKHHKNKKRKKSRANVDEGTVGVNGEVPAANGNASNGVVVKKALYVSLRTHDDDGDEIDLEADADCNGMGSAEFMLNSVDPENNSDPGAEINPAGAAETNNPDNSKALTEGLCLNVVVGVAIMVVILAIGTTMLWTVQRIMTMSHGHAAGGGSALGLEGGEHHHQVAVTAFSGAAMDGPFLRRLVPTKEKVVHPKDLSAYLARHEYKRVWEVGSEEAKKKKKKKKAVVETTTTSSEAAVALLEDDETEEDRR